MKSFMDTVKNLISKFCERKEILYINVVLLLMLIVSIAVNIFVVKENKKILEQSSNLQDVYYSGIATEMSYEGKLTYYYVVNGSKSDGFTGLAANHITNELLYFQDGVWNEKAHLVDEYFGEQYYIKNGKVNTEFSGQLLVGSTAYSIQRGRVNVDYTGIVRINNSWYYLKDGVQDKTLFDFRVIEELGDKYYFELGVCDLHSRCLVGDVNNYKLIINNQIDEEKSYTGAVRDENYICFMMKNGEIDTSYSGYYWDENWNKGYYLEKGVTARDKTLMVKKPGESSVLVYIKNGLNTRKLTGVVEVDGKQYYIKKNECDLTYSGEYVEDGKIYIIKDGIVKEVKYNAE